MSKDGNQVNLITKKAKSWWKFWEMYGEEKEPMEDEPTMEALHNISIVPDENDLPIFEDEKTSKRNIGRDGVKSNITINLPLYILYLLVRTQVTFNQNK